MIRFRRLRPWTLLLVTACADGSATPTESPPPTQAPPPAALTSTDEGPAGVTWAGEELRLTHQQMEFRVTGDYWGEHPAGIGLYLERPAGVGRLPMGLTVRQGGRNLWGTGLDEDSNDPYPDYVPVYQASVGDVFRFREGGRAILGNGIGRPEAEHVLTVQDRQNNYIENVLNLYATPGGSAERYLRAFNGEGIDFSLGTGGRTGVGKDHDPHVMLDVAGRARSRSYLQIEEPDQAYDLQAVVDVLDDLARLTPLRYTPSVGAPEPRYGLLETFVHDDVFPETVYRDPVDGTRSVDYAQVTTVLVAAVKELAARVEALEGGGRLGMAPDLCRPQERRRPGGGEAGPEGARTGARDGR